MIGSLCFSKIPVLVLVSPSNVALTHKCAGTCRRMGGLLSEGLKGGWMYLGGECGRGL